VAHPATRENHLLELRCTRCRGRSVRVLLNVTTVSQVQTTFACAMLCEISYDKYLRGEIGSFCINSLNVSVITLNEQTRFSVLTNWYICRAELRCEEVAISKAQVKSSVGGCSRRTRVRNAFGRLRLSDVPPSQRRDDSQSSLGVCAPTWVCNILIFILNNSFNRAYIHLLLRTFVPLHRVRMRAGLFWCKRGRTRRSCGRLATAG